MIIFVSLVIKLWKMLYKLDNDEKKWRLKAVYHIHRFTISAKYYGVICYSQ